jgi:hypothetical protein
MQNFILQKGLLLQFNNATMHATTPNWRTEPMNIFYLSESPELAALYHCDKHVVKMILETAQLLSTAHHELGGTATYKSTHKNHPSAVWVRQSASHYRWAARLWMELMRQYTYRYDKIHASARLADELRHPPAALLDCGFVPPPQCMPEECKDPCTVTAYRNYYRGPKAYMAQWRHSLQPDWMEEAKKVA